MTNDPISDMLATIRNGIKARLVKVATPASNVKAEIVRVMKASGYVEDGGNVSDRDEFAETRLRLALKPRDGRNGLVGILQVDDEFPGESVGHVRVLDVSGRLHDAGNLRLEI